jgi:hypothetical protein
MTFDQLNHLCDEILQSDSDRSALLASFSDTELHDAYVDVFRQYGVELVIGAEEKSTWMCELLVIGSNQGPIFACAAAFQAILLEMSKRQMDPLVVAIGCQ